MHRIGSSEKSESSIRCSKTEFHKVRFAGGLQWNIPVPRFEIDFDIERRTIVQIMKPKHGPWLRVHANAAARVGQVFRQDIPVSVNLVRIDHE